MINSTNKSQEQNWPLSKCDVKNHKQLEEEAFDKKPQESEIFLTKKKMSIFMLLI